ncbi:Panacea domain-containing protein [Convivina intestini]|nr:type II toxin-antitoxin system antitoxin SocA domain-containing protein [Convivina intestini]
MKKQEELKGNDMKTWSALQVVDWLRTYNFAELKENENAEELTQMKAMKLLYYIQGIALAAYGKKLFTEDLLAWRYGPVVKDVHDKYSGMRGIVNIVVNDYDVNENNGIDPEARKNFEEISNDDDAEVVLDTVMEFYGSKSAIELMKLTHNETPWQETAQSDVIDPVLLQTYFKENVLN